MPDINDPTAARRRLLARIHAMPGLIDDMTEDELDDALEALGLDLRQVKATFEALLGREVGR